MKGKEEKKLEDREGFCQYMKRIRSGVLRKEESCYVDT